ncbi:DNA-processing protein DprA [Dyella sp. GSA-30]|uniref:DNA-processing protein DprA n=1 Tax=Dyella sp. GSA-30 TaxID=2994496 RepID=UPI0024915CBE|nr:DNA-processing protein DprA [Dyella sp. GSA-30]BDU18919.1 DNA processing protein DprA [Dyella sp. GSA-30]
MGDNIDAWLTLLRTPGFGQAAVREWLTAAGGDIQAALAQAKQQASGRGAARARAWLRQPDTSLLASDRAWLAEPGHRLLCCDDADFPPQLETIDKPPAALFVAGRVELLLHPQVAIVGSRNATSAGLATARRFAQTLGSAGFVITSGMADGVDGAAHAAALAADLPTVAVVGTGLDVVYPRKHRELACQIAAQGAVVSEFPLGTSARAEHFPQRNRIISGLSLGTLVIEADLCSGSLITARLAAEQAREVFAVPGSIHNPLARGCHKLIRDGARLVETPTEVTQILTPAARALGLELNERLERAGSSPVVVSGWRGDPAYGALLQALGYDPTDMDDLVGRTGQSASALSSMLLMLELEGLVESLAGNRFQRLPEAG